MGLTGGDIEPLMALCPRNRLLSELKRASAFVELAGRGSVQEKGHPPVGNSDEERITAKNQLELLVGGSILSGSPFLGKRVFEQSSLQQKRAGEAG